MNRVQDQVRFLFGLGLCSVFFSESKVCAREQTREWKDLQGRVIQAMLKDATQEKVILSKEGREYVLSLARLSEGDREYVNENIGWVECDTSLEQSTRNERVIGRRIRWQSEVMLARQIIKGFIDSPAHKKTLLDRTKAYIGAGGHVYCEHVFVTQNFY